MAIPAVGTAETRGERALGRVRERASGALAWVVDYGTSPGIFPPGESTALLAAI